MRMRDLLPGGDRKTREAIEEVFSRDVLGAVVLGTAAGKTVESIIRIWVEGASATNIGYLLAWLVAFHIGVAVFVYWHEITEAAKEAAEEATDG